MKCMSCKKETRETKVLLKMHLCEGCSPLVLSAINEIDEALKRAASSAYDVLTQHVLRGGLLRTEPHFGEGEK